MVCLNQIPQEYRFDNNKPIFFYEVGGCVRDFLLGRKIKDVDYLVTNISFEKLKLYLSSISDEVVETDVGDRMGVLKCIISNQEYDFVIPRTEVYTGPKHTDVISYGDPSLTIEEDLSRRDFTINAMARNGEEIIDPYGGIEDIKNKLIRCVGDADTRFSEDALRILRAIQFSVRFGFKIENTTLESMKKNLYRLQYISQERIYLEFKKAYTSNNNYFVDIGHLIGLWDFLGMNPVRCDNISSEEYHFLLLYLNGGDCSKMPGYISNIVERYNLNCDLFEKCYRYKNKKYIFGIMEHLGIDYRYVKNFEEIGISSEEIISSGYKGREISEKQKELCKKDWEGFTELRKYI